MTDPRRARKRIAVNIALMARSSKLIGKLFD